MQLLKLRMCTCHPLRMSAFGVITAGDNHLFPLVRILVRFYYRCSRSDELGLNTSFSRHFFNRTEGRAWCEMSQRPEVLSVICTFLVILNASTLLEVQPSVYHHSKAFDCWILAVISLRLHNKQLLCLSSRHMCPP